MTRVLALWCPGWSLLAASLDQGLDPDLPLALTDRGRIHAASSAAAEEGVAPGLRVREAQNRCPHLTLLPHDTVRDEHAFEPVLRAIDEVIPGVDVCRPGLVAVRAAGPSRFYGSEVAAARELANHLRGIQRLIDLRIGIADGRYSAEQAAQQTQASEPLRIIEPGGSRAFLAALPLDVLDDQSLATVLRRLGMTSLGDFAALPAGQVRARFGEAGRRAHQQANGLAVAPLVPATPPPELTRQVDFEPGLDRVDQVAFGCRTMATDFIATLTGQQLVCSQLRITVFTERSSRAAGHRVWTHPRHFTSTELVDRIRWQLQGAESTDSPLTAPITRVEVEPVAIDSASSHASGLWGDGPDERIHHTVTRIQSRLGHHGVLSSAVGGGRLLSERRILKPWGDALPTVRERRADQPWPGSLPGLAPSLVFIDPATVRVLDADRAEVRLTARGELTAEPVWFAPSSEVRRVTAWAGPWPIRQRWWDPRQRRRVDRLQLVDDHDQAWLLLFEDNWRAEGRYD